jgi:uncharacterized protein
MQGQKRSVILDIALNRLLEKSIDINGVAVVSLDGLTVASKLSSKMDAVKVGAVAASIHNLANRSVSQLERGELLQTLIQGKDGNIIITNAGKYIAFVVLTRKEINLGMAFLEAREGAQKVAEILS